MIRLGLRLSLFGGRAARVRVALIAVALAIGVAVLLSASWVFPADSARGERVQRRELTFRFPPDGAFDSWLVWSARTLSVPGARALTTIALAPHGPRPPVPVGANAIPRPGEVLVSPALRDALARSDGGGLRAAMHGRVTGTLGMAVLHDPRDLVMMTGYDEAGLRRVDPDATTVTGFRGPAAGVDATALGRVIPITLFLTLLFVIPLLVFVGTAARLGARRRERRLAAMRLVGATPAQVRTLAAVETATAGVIGVVLGVLVALAIRAYFVASHHFFAAELPLTPARVLVVAAIIPLLAALGAPLALRRAGRASMLRPGVSAARSASVWRWTLLVCGWVLFAVGVVLDVRGVRGASMFFVVAFLSIAFGLVGVGPRVMQTIARWFGTRARRPAPLLGARRLLSDARAGFRSMSVLVVAMFLVSVILVVGPSLDRYNANRRSAFDPSATVVPDLVVSRSVGGVASLFGSSPNVPIGTALRARLRAVLGVESIVPVEVTETKDPAAPAQLAIVVADCPSLAHVLHASTRGCGTGVLVRRSGATAYGTVLDLGAYGRFPIAGTSTLLDRAGVSALVPPGTAPALDAAANRLWLRVDGSATTARAVRDTVAAAAPGVTVSPGTDRSLRIVTGSAARWWWYGALGFVLVLAACSLAVTTVEGVFERRRSLATLQALGTPAVVLRRAALVEVTLPLAVATLLGVVDGIAVGLIFVSLVGAPVLVAWRDVVIVPAMLATAWIVVSALAVGAVGRVRRLESLRAA